MITREIPLRVRYCDTDMMGIVHHSNYIRYYETARTEMLREFGTTYKELEDKGIMMPVLEATSRYLAPAYYDDELKIKVTLMQLPVVKMIFDYEIRNQRDELINTGRVVLAYMHCDSRRACRAPEWFLEIMKQHWVEE